MVDIDTHVQEVYDTVELKSRVVVVATLTDPANHGRRAVGVAICSPDDRGAFDFVMGKVIARGRALAELDGRATLRRKKRARMRQHHA